MNSREIYPMQLKTVQGRARISDSYVTESSEEQILSSSQWKTMYKLSYTELPFRGSSNNIASLEPNSFNKLKSLVYLATTYTQNYRDQARNPNRFLEGNIRMSCKEGIPIQQIANNPLNVAGYGSVESTRCKWFFASENNRSWKTMYQTQYRNPDIRCAGTPNNIKAPTQYRLEQIYRHMGNRV